MREVSKKPISTIFFDFGNTLINYTLDPFFSWLSEQYKIPRHYFWNLFGEYPHGLIFPYECGQSNQDFLSSFKEKTLALAEKIKGVSLAPPQYTDKEFEFYWNQIFDPNPISRDKIDLLEKLKNSGYTLIIVSNTNAMHRDYIIQAPRFQELLSFFVCYLASCDLGCRKTKLRHDKSNRLECERVFWKACRSANCMPEESVLVDDIEPFVEVFEQMGGNGIYHRGSWTEIESRLYSLGIGWT